MSMVETTSLTEECQWVNDRWSQYLEEPSGPTVVNFLAPVSACFVELGVFAVVACMVGLEREEQRQ